ncbi:hypothetical protein [Nostoc sp. JL31]|uniref:hypothetical protein n=1 Tax=Nostoc sp. JL31 TaxID=2815395 RepID=UPI0025F4E9C1|nr:hypothetical protein [Nostoc sp. JL31]
MAEFICKINPFSQEKRLRKRVQQSFMGGNPLLYKTLRVGVSLWLWEKTTLLHQNLKLDDSYHPTSSQVPQSIFL